MLDSLKASVRGEDNSLRVESRLPHFVAMSDDPFAAEVIIYPLREGDTFIGRETPQLKPDIVIAGEGIDDAQCYVTHEVEHDAVENTLRERVIFHPIGEHCYVDNTHITTEVNLIHGNIVQLGENVLFRFNHPTEALRMRKIRDAAEGSAQPSSSSSLFAMGRNREATRLAQEKEKLEEEKVGVTIISFIAIYTQ